MLPCSLLKLYVHIAIFAQQQKMLMNPFCLPVSTSPAKTSEEDDEFGSAAGEVDPIFL